MAEEVKKNCYACAYSYMEPSDMDLVCGHKDSGAVGLYIHRALEHCGPERTKFEQHPLRNPDGSLKQARSG